jgi:hypothetical protein
MTVQSRLPRLAAAVVAVALVAPAARAQNAAAVVQTPNTIEIGADAGATFGLGEVSSVNITLPAQRARVGFFLNNDSRVSIEPAVGFGYNKAEGQPGQTNYLLEAGALYHFRPARLITDVANRAAVSYARPFVGFTGVSLGGDAKNENEVFAGFGVGVKIPYRTNIAVRAEANLGYGFDNDAARIGVNLGLSFFTRRAQ